jgi:uncharacterized protein (TIGR03437 family)
LACASSLVAAGVSDRNTAKTLLARVPLSFERNAGQAADKSAAWVGHGHGYGVTLGATGATVVPAAPGRSDRVRMTFLNARPQAGSSPLDPLPGKTNYLIGADPNRWLRNLPTYGRIEYRNVYDGIDVAWYGDQGQIEYDFTIRPGADPSRIRMSVEGARKLALGGDGAVDIETAAGAMKLRLPQIYQTVAGARRPVQGSFSLDAGNVIGFKLASYDRTQPLVIDPTLVYGSFLGGGIFGIAAIATDSLGDVYVAGDANAGMATVTALQPGDLTANSESCFIMKLNPAGTAVLYSTYIGGSTGSSQIEGIAVDSSGELVGTGMTGAKDFPLVNPAWSKFDTTNNQSAIVLKLSADGSALVYSTYLSGVVDFAVALDGSGNAYVVGDAESTVVATSGAYQTVYGGGENDAFVAKLGKAGALAYLTLLGGSGYDQGNAIAVDSAGNAYIAGYTNSVSFPGNPPGARTTNAGGYDVFVAKVSPDGSSVPWLTFLGGTGDETQPALVRNNSNGMLYIAGSTTSTDLPTTAGVIQPSSHGLGQGFIASVNPDGMSFGFVTYLGGTKYDTIRGIALTPSWQLAVAGTASSSDFASVNAIQPAFLGNGVSFFESANSGGSWTADDAGLPTSIVAITGDPTNANTVLALSTNPPRVFRTTNGGATWAAEPLPGTFWWVGGSPAFARSPGNPAVVYAYLPFTNGPSPYEFVFRSTDDGVTWTGLPNPPASATDWLEGIALSGTDAKTFVEVFESGDVYRSTDGGATFTALAPLGGACGAAWPGALTGSPDGSMYLGTYGGICKSTDNGSTWSQLAATSNWNPSAIAVAASNPLVVYAINNGGVYASADAGKTWNSGTSPGGSVSTLAVAASNPQIVYAVGGGGVFVSKNGANTWTPTASLPFYPYGFAVSATDPSTVYTGGNSATEGFVAKLDTAGTSLLWSTFYTGSGGSYPSAIGSAASGDLWVAGSTSSADLPITANAYSNVFSSDYGAAFLARISDTTAPCSYWLNPASMISYGPQTLTFSVTAPSGCAWTATASDNTWITVNTGSGTASGVVSATLTANDNESPRTGSVSVGGQSFAITQAPSDCPYSIDTSGTSLPSSGGTVEIYVSGRLFNNVHMNLPSNCPWNVTPGPGVTVVSGGSGTGNGVSTLSIAPNPSVQSYSTTVEVAGKSIRFSVADDCTYSLSPLTLSQAAQSGSMSVTASPAGCSWYPQSDASWLTLSGNTTTGSGTFPYTATANATQATRTAHITLDGRQFTVTQNGLTAQTISFGALSNQVLGAAPIALNATASSGLPVSFSSLTTSVCVVSGATVNPVAVGTCVIQASQAGNATYGAAVPVNQSFTVTAIAQPAITGVGVSGGNAGIAQNAWTSIYGTNLAPARDASGLTWSTAPSFASGVMPTSLDGVSVTVNGKPAYVSFICPTQINVLTPLDSTVGPVAVVVNNGSTTSAAYTDNLQAVSPGFLRFGDVIHIVAQHADYSFVGPASLSVPGYTFTPAVPGEVIALYGDGFGLPVTTLTAGSMYQSGALPEYPQITIGGVASTVQYAAVISPGLYQINVLVPAVPSSGDNQLIATYAGVSSPTGAMIPVVE